MIRNIIVSLLLIVFIVSLAFLFLYKKDDRKVCKAVLVSIVVPRGANQFMRDSDVLRELDKKGFKLKGLQFKNINMSKIEDVLNDNPLFSDAQVTYSLEKESLVIVLNQKYPKYIVQMGNSLYYVGENKKLIPVDLKYIVDVPLVTGDIDSLTAIKPYPLIHEIEKDSMMQNLIGQIYFDKNKGFTIIPRVANVPMILGDESKNWDKKIKKVHIFISKILPKIGWNKIKYIDLSFKNQIVVADKNIVNNS